MDTLVKLLKQHWLLFSLLVLTFILRIINLNQLFYFTYDEEVPAFVGRRLVLYHHIPLIGGVTPFGVHLAPYFYWLLSVVLWIGRLNPVAWGYAGALIAVVTTGLMYLVGQELSSKKLGLIAATLWTFSYLAIVSDRHFWALYWGPLSVLVTIFCLLKIIKGKEKFVYLLAVSLAFFIHTDLSNYMSLLLAVLAWIVFRIPFKKSTVLAILIIVLSFLPLIVFDLRHDFANTAPALKALTNDSKKTASVVDTAGENIMIFPQTFTRAIYTFGDDEIAKQYSYCQDFIAEKFQEIPTFFIELSSLIILGFIIWSFRARKKEKWRLVTFIILLYFFGLNIYGLVLHSPIYEHYITGLFPAFLLIFAKIIDSLPKKIWFLVLLIFIVFNGVKLLGTRNSQGLLYKEEAISYTMQQVGDQPFSLDSLSTCWKYSGYRYLFAVFGREPVKSYVDPSLAYLYGPAPVADKHPATVVSFITHDFVPETPDFYQRYSLLKSHTKNSASFGNIEVLIIDNKDGWFNSTQ
jgi:hypothetical protein